MTSAAELVRRVTDLPTLPAVCCACARSSSSGQFCARGRAGNLLRPGLTLRLLRVANGAYYGMARKVESVMDAIAILAPPDPRIVLATSITMAFAGVAPPLITCAGSAHEPLPRRSSRRCLAKQSRQGDAERAFVEGLVGDIGHW